MSLLKWLGDVIVDTLTTRMLDDKYEHNLFELFSTTDKITPVIMMETALRAKHGQAAERPFGSIRIASPWEKLFLNPTHLYRMPLETKQQVDLKVTIGPRTSKPLVVDIPILISGMSFGSALSKEVKVALAKAATLVGTATNSGEAGLLKEEKEAAEKFIGQFNRGGWMNKPELLRQLDAVEIQLGQGAQAASPQRTRTEVIGEDFREIFGLGPGEDAVIHSRLPNVNSPEEFIQTVHQIRDWTDGVPVGLKIAATHYIEKELEFALEADIDYIVVDGAEAGSHAAAATLADDLGLPTLPALVRTVDYLKRVGRRDDVTVIASGGLRTPGEFLKAIALGADCVYIGTTAILALVGEQIIETTPWEPPTELVLYTGSRKSAFDIERGVKSLVNFFNACRQEMEAALIAMGRERISDLDRSDLCCVDRELAEAIGVDYAYAPPTNSLPG